MQEQIDAVQRMQEYIEAHLFERITLNALAEVSCYSPWYAHRLFLKWLDLTPADYIRRLRLSKSALMLRDSDAKIGEVAFAVGFQSVDGYQRAFFREFGCNPGEYAAQPSPVFLFTPYGVASQNAKECVEMEEIKTVLVQVVEKPARRAVIKRGRKATDYFAYCEEVGCDIWGLLTSMKSLCGEPVCMWLPPQMQKPGTSEYVQGVEVSADYAGKTPEGFDVIDLPACKYLAFQGEPFEERDYQAAIAQVWKAIERCDPALFGCRWDKSNPRIQLEPRGERGYLELLPVKPL